VALRVRRPAERAAREVRVNSRTAHACVCCRLATRVYSRPQRPTLPRESFPSSQTIRRLREKQIPHLRKDSGFGMTAKFGMQIPHARCGEWPCEFEHQRGKDFHRSKSEERTHAFETRKHGSTPEVPDGFTSVPPAFCYFAGIVSNFPEPSS
jgi:hypothetical protein